MKQILKSVLILISIISFNISAEQIAVGTVTVNLQSNSSVAGHDVVLNSLYMATFSEKQTSDQSGTLVFTNVPVGNFEVRVLDNQSQAMVNQQSTLSTANETMELTISLP